MGLLERGSGGRASRVRAKRVAATDRNTLHGRIKAHVEPKSHVLTDAHPGYRSLERHDYVHEFVDHAVRYVEGHVHTNGLENFWCLTKRCIKGTYVHVDPVHLDRYLDMSVFRFNNRTLDDLGRFQLAAMSIAGKRLTYEELTHGDASLLER